MMRRILLLGVCGSLIASAALAQPVQPPTGGTITATPGTSPNGTPVTCTISSATTCGPFTPTTPDFKITHVTTGFTASCQMERQSDGTDWAVVTVTASGSTTQMYNWSFSASTTNLSEDLSEPKTGIPYRLNCTSYSAGSDAVTIK